MRTKHLERARAAYLRKKGKTISEIADELHVSKSSVSLWLQGISLPQNTLIKLESRRTKGRLLANEAKRMITLTKLKAASVDSQEIVNAYKVDTHSALILCALMYWCEGSKSKNDSEFTFTNSDPVTIAGFLSLFRKALKPDETRFRVKMHLHSYHDEQKQKKFWSDITNIPTTQFQSTFWKDNSNINIKEKYPGCVHVRYHDVTIARKISAVARNFFERINMVE